MGLKIHKILEVVTKIKIPYLTLLIAFVSSFNLWFLSFYFFKNGFIATHGIVITLLCTFALTTTWVLICAVNVPKATIINLFLISKKPLEDADDFFENDTMVIFFIFFEVILLHSAFLYFSYLFGLSFFSYLTVAFSFVSIQYLVSSFVVAVMYSKHAEETSLAEYPSETVSLDSPEFRANLDKLTLEANLLVDKLDSPDLDIDEAFNETESMILKYHGFYAGLRQFYDFRDQRHALKDEFVKDASINFLHRTIDDFIHQFKIELKD